MRLLLATLIVALTPLSLQAFEVKRKAPPPTWEGKVRKIPTKGKKDEDEAPARKPKKTAGPGETLIWGQVVDHEGKARTGGVVNVVVDPVSSLERSYPGFGEGQVEGMEKLDEEGWFEIVRKVPDGRHLVKALVDEGDNLRVATAEVVVADRWAEPVTLRLGTPVQLQGIVTDTAKKPLARVPLAIVPVPPPSLGGETGLRRPSPGSLTHVESAADGTFTFDPVDPGRYAVFPVGATYHTGGTLIVHAGDKATLIVSKKPILSAKVVDQEGHPIPVFQAKLDGEPAGFFRNGVLELALARRDAGAGVLELLAPEHPAYTVPQSIPLQGTDDLDLGELKLPEGRKLLLQIRGLVKGPNVSGGEEDGQDSDHLEVRVFRQVGSEQVEEPALVLPEPVSEKGGLSYELKGLSEEPLQFLLEAPGRAPFFLEVPRGAKKVRGLFKRGSQLELTVLNPGNLPVPEAVVHLRQELRGVSFLHKGVAGQYGRVEFSGLIGGDAVVQITATGMEPTERTLEVPERGRHTERLTLKKEKPKVAPPQGG
ncbi:MAG: carboxypeptidase-like regulatory domain-containing protein [Deltaproteobacteria bacterium]|nr:carboxypeptidase-like regulatory domain-containing protein [Deltaproteobacteria bacterium]